MSTTTQDGASQVDVDAAEAPPELGAAPVAERGVVPVTTPARAGAGAAAESKTVAKSKSKAKAKAGAQMEGAVATLAAAPDTAAAPVIPATTAVTAPKRPKAPPRERTFGTKVAGQPAFVLHSYPYKETSLIIDLFTRDFGRVALIAKGAKRPHSQLRGVLQTFQPLSSSWVGKSELRTLTDAEWVGGMLPLEKTALLCGFYLNELLVKLLARDDAHPALFDHYVATLNQLAHNEPAPIVLRKFERALLKETGVSADLSRCTTTRGPVRADVVYVVDPERGPRPERASDQSPRVTGKTLLDMEREDYRDAATQSQSKQLMRYLLAHHLGGAPLNTRQILIDLSQL